MAQTFEAGDMLRWYVSHVPFVIRLFTVSNAWTSDLDIAPPRHHGLNAEHHLMAFSSPTHSQTHPDMPSIPIQLVPSEAHPERVYKCVFSGCSEIQRRRRRLDSRGSFILPRRTGAGPGSGQDLKGQSGTLGEGKASGLDNRTRVAIVMSSVVLVVLLIYQCWNIDYAQVHTHKHTHVCSRLLWMLLPRTFLKW